MALPTTSKKIPLTLLLFSASACGSLAVGACSAFGDAEGPPPAADVVDPEAPIIPDATVPDTSVADSADGDGESPCVASPPGLVAWWTGDDTLEDHEKRHHATSTGMPTFHPGKHGSAFKFPESATTSPILVSDAPGLDFETGLTIEAWIRPDRADQDARIVDKITAGEHDGYLLDLEGGHLRLIVKDKLIRSPMTLGPDLVHVAGTFDSQGTGRLYVDGVEVVSANTGVQAIPKNDLPLTIGSTSKKLMVFNGIIDELAVYDRALTAQEVAAIARAPQGRCK